MIHCLILYGYICVLSFYFKLAYQYIVFDFKLILQTVMIIICNLFYRLTNFVKISSYNFENNLYISFINLFLLRLFYKCMYVI